MPRLTLVLILAAAPALFAQQTSPGVTPPAMSENYNPFVWKGDDANFALEMLQENFCATQMSKHVASVSFTPDVQSLAHAAARQQEHFYRKLRSMAKEFTIWLPPETQLKKCHRLERMRELSGTDLDKTYIASLEQSNAANISRVQAEVARPEKPDNSSLRQLAVKSLPGFEDLQAEAQTLQK